MLSLSVFSCTTRLRCCSDCQLELNMNTSNQISNVSTQHPMTISNPGCLKCIRVPDAATSRVVCKTTQYVESRWNRWSAGFLTVWLFAWRDDGSQFLMTRWKDTSQVCGVTDASVVTTATHADRLVMSGQTNPTWSVTTLWTGLPLLQMFQYFGIYLINQFIEKRNRLINYNINH